MSASVIATQRSHSNHWLRRLARAPITSEPWRAAGFMLTSFVVGTFWFVALVTLIATGFGLAITWIGIPILAFTVLAWIGGARLERLRVRLFFGERIASPYRPIPKDGLLRRARVLLTDTAVWRDLLYLFLLFPIGVAEFVIVVTLASLS